jgi:hypothetical protein
MARITGTSASVALRISMDGMLYQSNQAPGRVTEGKELEKSN